MEEGDDSSPGATFRSTLGREDTMELSTTLRSTLGREDTMTELPPLPSVKDVALHPDADEDDPDFDPNKPLFKRDDSDLLNLTLHQVLYYNDWFYNDDF